MNVILLAAGYNKYSDKPCSLWSLGNVRSILDWQMHAFQTSLPDSEVNIAVGYNYQSIIANHPCHTFKHVLDWENGGALHSFLSVLNDYSSHTLVMYGDTVFRSETLAEFNDGKGDVIVAIDSVWKQRFSKRSQEDIDLAETLNIKPHGEVEYTGLIKFSPRVLEWLSQHRDDYQSKSSFIDLLKDLKEAGFEIVTYDVAGDWAEMNEQSDLVHFILGSKAETLRRIQPKLKKSKVCDQITHTWCDWTKNPKRAIKEVQSKFAGQRLIIRSSSSEEDGWETANAGVFESILNVDCKDAEAVRKAIDNVFSSYGERPPHAQVLVQPFVTDVIMSGVLFTCDLITGAPYYIINYDDVSGRTDSITSGQTSDLSTVIAFRHEINSILSIDPRLGKVIDAAQELEQLLGYNKLDIEFAIDNSGQCFTFQIRPIAVSHACYQVDEKNFYLNLQNAKQQFKSWQKNPPHILGKYTVFSGMTDWNPAEIIGTRPNALAVNLYNHIITEEIWAKQRSEFGYRNIIPTPLVHSFCAQPYVDCRASINSFIPADLSDDCALRLVDAYLDILKENPHLHDKLELDVVFTIWVPTFREDAKQKFKDRNVSELDIIELEQALKKVTVNALMRLDEDTSSINILTERFELLTKADLRPVERIYQLIEDCKKFGTLAFSHAARAGFVAVTLLKSLVKAGCLTQDRMLEFQASVPTVASDFQSALVDSNVSTDDLIRQFGHLRPGTYDVNQPAYWENPAFYFVRNKQSHLEKDKSEHGFAFTEQERLGLQEVLEQLSIDLDLEDFIEYLSRAIQARESVKLDFTRNLSKALDLTVDYGVETLGLTREDVGFLTFDDIKSMRTGQLNERQVPEFVKLRKSSFEEQQLAKLPSFISREEDFFGFEQEKSEANFITRLMIVADLAFVKSDQTKTISGKIHRHFLVLIRVLTGFFPMTLQV
jgi:choline kinase